MKLIKVHKGPTSRLSGNASFPAPNKDQIGKKVTITRHCITWQGALGYFNDDPNETTHAFYLSEIK